MNMTDVSQQTHGHDQPLEDHKKDAERVLSSVEETPQRRIPDQKMAVTRTKSQPPSGNNVHHLARTINVDGYDDLQERISAAVDTERHKIEKYERRLQEAEQNVQHFQGLLDQQAAKSSAELGQQIALHEKAIYRQKQEYATEAKDLTDKLAHADADRDRLEATVKRMQAAAFKSVEAASWSPDSVSDINHKLNDILTSIKKWSEKHSRADFVARLPQDRNGEMLRTVLENSGCMARTNEACEVLFSALKSPAFQKKAPSLLLSTVVASDVFIGVFGSPWFACASSPHESQAVLAKNDHHTLGRIMALLQMGDQTTAHAWRVQLMRAMHPAKISTQGDEAIQSIVNNSKKCAAEELADTIVFNHGSLFLQPGLEDSAFKDLFKIIRDAADDASRFWTQKTEISVYTLLTISPLMSESKKEPVKFFASSKFLDASPLHIGDLNDDDTALDGKLVVLLCCPIVAVKGNVEGTDYDKVKVWKKGVAWMGRGK